MGDGLATLKFTLQVDGQGNVVGAMKDVEAAATSMSDKTVAATGRMASESEASTGRMASSFQNLAGLAALAAEAFATIKLAEFIKDATLLAARYETLGVVMNVVGANSVHTASEMAGFQQGLQKTGISAVEARQGLALMGQAQVDMAKSSALARVAQDAAVIANTNSSEAFNNMMTGISTGQAIILHHMGLMVNFEGAYKSLATTLGKSKEELTAQELTQARVSEVMRVSVGIAGSYEAALGTAGKQLNSMKRYWQDLMVAMGASSQGPLLEGITALTNSLRFVTKHFDEIKIGAMVLGSVIIGVFTGLAAQAVATWATTMVIQFALLRMEMIAAGMATTAFGFATAGATLAMNGLKAAFVSNPVGLIVMALTTAISLWMTYTKVQSDALDKSAPKDNPVLVNLREETALLQTKIDLIKKGKDLETITDPQVMELKRLDMQKQFVLDQNGGGGTAFRVAGIEMEHAELEKGIPIVAALRKEYAGLTATKKEATPVEMQTAAEYGESLRKAHEGYLAYVAEWDKRLLAESKNSSELQLNDLKHQLDQQLITAREFGQKSLDEKVAQARQAKVLDDGRYQEAVTRAAQIEAVVNSKKQKNGTFGEGFLPDGSQVGVTEYNSANKAVEAARIQKEAAAASLQSAQQDQEAYAKTNTVLDATAIKELAIQKLEATGQTLQAEEYRNLLKYAELWQKTGSQKLVNLTREVDDIKSANDLYARQVAVRNQLAALDAANSAQAASMVGVNPATGGIDTVADQTAHDLSVQQDAHNQRLDMIDQERQAAMDCYAKSSRSAEDYALVVGTLAAKERARALEEHDNANKGAAITEKSYKSQLAVVGNYASLAGGFFTALADTQDQTSRKGFETAKAFNIGAAIMSTAAAVMNALATVQPYPLALGAAALAAATGVIQVAKIASTSFGGGAAAIAPPAGSYGAVNGSTGDSSGQGYFTGGAAESAAGVSSGIGESLNTALLNLITATNKNTGVLGTMVTVLQSSSDSSVFSHSAPGQFNSLSEGSSTGLISGLTNEVKTFFQGAIPGLLSFGDYMKGALGINAVQASLSTFFGIGNSWGTQAAGITAGVTNGEFQGQTYIDQKKNGGWFTSDKYRTQTGAMDSATAAWFQGQVDAIKANVTAAANILGTSTTDLANVAITSTRIATAGRSTADIQKDVDAWVTGIQSDFAKTIVGLDTFTQAGETAGEAYIRLATAAQGVQEIFTLTGNAMEKVSLQGADLASSLVTAYGGLDKLKTANQDFVDAVYTPAEDAAYKAADSGQQVTSAFASIGLAVPQTNEALIALRQGLDTSTASGLAMWKVITDIGPAFAVVTKQADDLAAARLSFANDLAERSIVANGGDATLFKLRVTQAEEMKQAILNGMDAQALQIMQDKEWAAAVAKATGVVTQSLADLATAAKTAVSSMLDAQTAILNSMKSLSTANLSPEGAYAQAQSSFAALSGKTDLASLQALPDAANTLLTASKNYNATGAAYQADLTRVLDVLGAASGMSGDISTPGINAQIALLADIKSALISSDSALISSLGDNGDLVKALGPNSTLAGLIGTWNADTAAALLVGKQSAATETFTRDLKTYTDSQVAAIATYRAGTTDAAAYSAATQPAYNAAAGDNAAAVTLGVSGLALPNYTAISAADNDARMMAKAGGIASLVSNMALGITPANLQYDVAPFGSPDGVITSGDAIAWMRIASGATKWSETGLAAFANGGIADQASIFAEAGPEAAVPLPDGRTIPVTLRYADSYSRKDGNAELLNEVKKQNVQLKEVVKHLQAVVKVSQAGFGQLIDQGDDGNKNAVKLRRAVGMKGLM
jgi:hypothetical protein